MGAKNSREKTDRNDKKKDIADNQKVPMRQHQYEDIPDELLAVNQNQHQEEMDKEKVDDSTAAAAAATANGKPNAVRVHPYDEVTEEVLGKNRKAKKKLSFFKRKTEEGKAKKTKNKEVSGVPEDVRESEYSNVNVNVGAAQCVLVGGQEGAPGDEECVEYHNVWQATASSSSSSSVHQPVDTQVSTENEEIDVYAQPNKKPKQLSLNYIEVEVLPPTTKREVKRQYSPPTDYANVVNDQGKMVVMPES